jgi:hypothetical protein
MARRALFVAATPIFAAAIAWGAAVIVIDGPASPLLAKLGAAAFLLASLACLLAIRPLVRGTAVFTLLFGALLTWWVSLEPSNERDWMPDVARTATAVIDGDRLTIRNVRNFHYRSDTDFDERWEERSYDLSKLIGFDLFLSHWGSPHIAHTIASWDFADGKHLAISIETRKERGEAYSAVLGFFRQFEIYYVVADERDLVGQRTGYRGEDVYLYRLTTSVPDARALLIDYLEEVNRLAQQPQWYNALTHNCTTTIRRHAQHVGVRNPLRWQIIANGHLDELAYDRGQIDTSLPFEEVRERSYVTDVAQGLTAGDDFSVGIRRDVPNPRR